MRCIIGLPLNLPSFFLGRCLGGYNPVTSQPFLPIAEADNLRLNLVKDFHFDIAPSNHEQALQGMSLNSKSQRWAKMRFVPTKDIQELPKTCLCEVSVPTQMRVMH